MLEFYSDIQFSSYKVDFLVAELLTYTYGYFYGIFLTKGVPWYGSLRRALNRGANTFPRNGGDNCQEADGDEKQEPASLYPQPHILARGILNDMAPEL